MQLMPGWSISERDVAAGIVLLIDVIVIGVSLQICCKILSIDVGGECHEDLDECHCDGSGHEPAEKPSTCGNCGRYVEIGGE